MRSCAGCGQPIVGRRSDAIYCTDACRREAVRVGGPEAPALASAAQTFWKQYASIRRSRGQRARHSAPTVP